MCLLSLLFLQNTDAAKAQVQARKPNLVIILADDLGYGDVHCYNPERGKIPTPHLDRLATQGMRFTDAHSSSAVCSPSRYALLTGRYHWRSRLQQGIVNLWQPPLIAPNRLTLASLATQHGYRTACIGKWHLGWDWPISEAQRPHFTNLSGNGASEAQRTAWREVFSQPLGGGPLGAGFEAYFGTDVPNWPPYCFIENNRTVGIPSELLPARLLQKRMASLPGPALPGWSLESILPALGDRACAFVTNAAKGSEPFLLYLPLTTPHTPLAVTEEWRGRSGLESDVADLVMESDAIVGRVLTALEQSGAAENTIVLFTSDNGFAPISGAKELEAQGHFPSGPLRGYKFDVWEGGHRIPFIVRWPGVVQGGSVCHELVHHADLLATVAEVLGTRLPANAGEDSFSVLPLLKGSHRPVREHAVSCSGNGVPSVRQGSWKLILAPDPKAATPVQLYNLAADLGETNNLAAIENDRVVAMRALLEKLITNGRSTPGAPQHNDVEVRRFPASPQSKRK